MIRIDSIWSFDNGINGIVDFTVIAAPDGGGPEKSINVRAVETRKRGITIVAEQKLSSFIREFTDSDEETLNWLKRLLSWHLDSQRSPAFVTVY